MGPNAMAYNPDGQEDQDDQNCALTIMDLLNHSSVL